MGVSTYKPVKSREQTEVVRYRHSVINDSFGRKKCSFKIDSIYLRLYLLSVQIGSGSKTNIYNYFILYKQ